MESARFDFEALQPSMLRMIRSARSRLRQEAGFEEEAVSARPGLEKSRPGLESAINSASLSSSVASRRVSDVKRTSSRLVSARGPMAHAANSENVEPEKSYAPTQLNSVLGDATNTYNSFGQRPPTGQDAKPSLSEKLIAHSIPTARGGQDKDGLQANRDNPQCAEEYAQDIFKVLKRDEPLHLPSPNYMDRQIHVNAKMRAILIDWLVDVHKKYKLRAETLFLAVQLIDRYLEVQVAAQRHLQLVGVTALMIAAKFEEIHPPHIKDFVYVTDKAYSNDEIIKMEVCILKALKFKISTPTAMHFLERYQSVNGCTDSHRDLAQYLLELSLPDYKMLKYTPSHLAAASILLSNKLLRLPSWPSAAIRHTNMTEPTLKECAKEMCKILECAEHSSLQAVRRKFSQAKYNAVAKLNFMSSAASYQATAPSVCTTRRSIGGATTLV